MNNPQAVRSKLTIATVCSDVAQGKSGGLIFGCVVFHVVQWQDGSLLVFAGSIPVRADAGSIPDVEIFFLFCFTAAGGSHRSSPKRAQMLAYSYNSSQQKTFGGIPLSFFRARPGIKSPDWASEEDQS